MNIEELRTKVAAWERFDSTGRMKTAGEVIFTKKDTALTRDFTGADWKPDARNIKALAQALWSITMAFGHLHTGAKLFSKIKSSTISPDGKLGGRGYVKAIPSIRTKLHEATEILSDITDTLHDEITGPHWTREREGLSPKEDKKIENLIEESKDVAAAPEKTTQIEEDSDVADDVESEILTAVAERKKQGSRQSSRALSIASRVCEMYMDRQLAPMRWEDPEQKQPQWSNPTGSDADFMKLGPDDKEEDSE